MWPTDDVDAQSFHVIDTLLADADATRAHTSSFPSIWTRGSVRGKGRAAARSSDRWVDVGAAIGGQGQTSQRQPAQRHVKPVSHSQLASSFSFFSNTVRRRDLLPRLAGSLLGSVGFAVRRPAILLSLSWVET